MKINKINLLVIFLVSVIIIFGYRNCSNAGLQANRGGQSLTNGRAGTYFDEIRKMETKNGTLGKEAELDEKYLDTTHNGIDAHMSLSTEYGAACILAYSKYGYKAGKKDTTSGNETGIYQLASGKSEYFAGIADPKTLISKANLKQIAIADSRYYNNYSSGGSKLGDGFILTNGAVPKDWPNIIMHGYGLLSVSTGHYGGAGSEYYGARATVVSGKNL